MTDKEIADQVQDLLGLAKIYKGVGLRFGIEKDLERAAATIQALQTEKREVEEHDDEMADEVVRLRVEVVRATNRERKRIYNHLSKSTMVTVAGKGGALEWLRSQDGS